MKAKSLKRGNHAHLQLYIATDALRVLDPNARGSKEINNLSKLTSS